MSAIKRLGKTTKKTEDKCLGCKHCNILRDYTCFKIIECTNDKVVSFGEFDSRDWTCIDNIKSRVNVKKDKYTLKGRDAEKWKQISLFDVT